MYAATPQYICKWNSGDLPHREATRTVLRLGRVVPLHPRRYHNITPDSGIFLVGAIAQTPCENLIK